MYLKVDARFPEISSESHVVKLLYLVNRLIQNF